MKENKYFRVIRTAKPGTNWPNGVDGRFIDIDDDGKYRFVPSTIGDWWDQDLSVITAHFYDLKEDEQYTSIIRKLPVVAWGLLPQYIRWEAEKDLKDIYAEYYGSCFETWKSNVRYDIELMRKPADEIEAAFVCAMIEDEGNRIEESGRRLFPYLPEDEQRILKQVGDGFIAYLQERHQKLEPQQEIPQELFTKQAMKYWNKAKQKGFVNDDFSFIGTRYQQAYFAEKFGEALGFRNKWKPFTTLWNYDKFAQTRRESKERFGYVERQNEIDQVFED